MKEDMASQRMKKIREIEKTLDEIWSDPELPKKVEEFQRKHGELTPEELREKLDLNSL